MTLTRIFKIGSFGPSTVTVFCICIVTVGYICIANGQRQNLNYERKVSGIMGRKHINAPVIVPDGATIESEGIPLVPKHHVEFNSPSIERSLEERLLAKENGGILGSQSAELKNPHPHVSAPQLPFCKPTKTTIGGSKASAEETKKGSNNGKHPDQDEDDLIGDSDEYDDVDDIVNTSDSVLETDRRFLVATLDGKVTLLNRTGHQLWTVKTGPLFSSTISSLQLNENDKRINLIPSLTGSVYKYDGESLYPMPFNADSLLKKSFKLSNDVVITGGKELRTFGIDVQSGNIRYDCGISGCVVPGDSELNASGDNSEDSVVLVVKKQLQTVRAIDSTSGSERWNFSVGTHELALAGVTEGCYHGEQRDDTGKVSDVLKIVIPEGRVFGADKENHVVWDQQFESPISQVWILENGQLVAVDPITNTPLTGVPSLYIGIHNQQFYVQESQSTAEKMEKYYVIDEGTFLKRKPLNIAWKPSTAITGATDTALTTITPKPAWVPFVPSATFRPIYIYDKDYVGDTLEGPNRTELDEDDSEDSDEDEPPELDFSDGITQVIVMSLWFWWKEVLGISLLTAVLLNVVMMKPIMRAVRSETIREMSGYFQQLWNRWKEEEESRALLARHSSNMLSLPAPEETSDLVEEGRKRSTSSSSTGSFNSPAEEREAYFTSQYLNEFIPIECLGRGGFGVVFEAKKKIDDRTYAVKRITLPDRETARGRVMREVIALARLEHKNIVRYFNAWIESPPPGWLEKNDPLWAKTLIGSPTPTMDYPSDMFGSSMLPESQRKTNKPDHSKISVPTTPCDQPNDDSYIVFESNTTASTPASLSKPSLFGSSQHLLDQSTSIPIPTSAETSTASSASGQGFFARRPTSLHIHSSVSSFHEDEVMSRNESVQLQYLPEEEKSRMAEDGDEAKTPEAFNVMYLYIQQELCQKSTLQDWLRFEKSRELPLVIDLFSQIVEAVEYVHSKKLIHRDLKPSNIFLAGVTENGFDMLTVKVGDFGLATAAYAELDNEKMNATPLDNRIAGQNVINLTGHVGTHLYMSPEQYHRKPYDYKVDIYSLGLIFFELLVPFSTDMERYNTLSGVRRVSFPETFKDLYPDEYELISTMISHNPDERPDAGKINTWVKAHLLKLPSSNDRTRHSNEVIMGRSVSSPADIKISSGENSPDLKKTKPKFHKTQSVM